MKRYASHFLFLPQYGYFKQCAVETEAGVVKRIFPLTEELENVEWLPGAIVLLTRNELKDIYEDPTPKNTSPVFTKNPSDFYYKSDQFLVKIHRDLLRNSSPLPEGTVERVAVYLPNFDIMTMQPVAGTRHRLLP